MFRCSCSAKLVFPQIMGRSDQQQEPQLCDFCAETQALLYCRADSAKLCLSCDHHVHSANALFGKHKRSQLCNSCNSAPASIKCSTENLFLCQNCDWHSHGSWSVQSSLNHDRRPVEGFTGCPTSRERASLLGFDLCEKSLLESEFGGGGISGSCLEIDPSVDCFGSVLYGPIEPWVWETPVVSMNDLIVPSEGYLDACNNVPTVGLPSLSKQRHIVCGKYKEEIISQLLDMLKSETSLNDDHGLLESVFEIKLPPLDQNVGLGIVRSPMMSANDDIDIRADANLRRSQELESIVVPCHETSTLQSTRGYGDHREATDLVHVSYEDSLGALADEVLVKSADINSREPHSGNDSRDQTHLAVGQNMRMHPKNVYELSCHDRNLVILRYKEKRKARRYDKQIRYESRKARADSRARIKGRFAKVNHDQNLNVGGKTV